MGAKGTRIRRTRRPTATSARVGPSSPQDHFRLAHGFWSVCTTLLEERFQDRWEQPIAYWALDGDRRLPRALLGRSLRNLAESPFDELAATQGVGLKKIRKLLTLLERAIRHEPTGNGADGSASADKNAKLVRATSTSGEFDPAQVSEAAWEQWRATILRFGVEREKLGRLVPSLRSLPLTLWRTPMQTYCRYSVAEIRRLKTHGAKRVRTILELFWRVHELLAGVRSRDYLAVRLFPPFVIPLELWIDRMLTDAQPASIRLADVHMSLVKPLVEQVAVDCGSIVSQLVHSRLGVGGQAQTIRRQAQQLGVTRARVYQLLKSCSEMMAVRWPEGRLKFEQVEQRFESVGVGAKARECVREVIELFFPNDHEIRAPEVNSTD